MHELPILQAILTTALTQADQVGAQRIVRLHLANGALSTVDDENVRFYLDVLSKGTKAEGAEVIIRTIPARLRCPACGREFSGGTPEDDCPACGVALLQAVSGRELVLESIDVEET
jgi:hydrogenase nickel incorporation protein HypA/HybF